MAAPADAADGLRGDASTAGYLAVGERANAGIPGIEQGQHISGIRRLVRRVSRFAAVAEQDNPRSDCV
jgi:hypothetical protein